jgi:hypothetical protein
MIRPTAIGALYLELFALKLDVNILDTSKPVTRAFTPNGPRISAPHVISIAGKRYTFEQAQAYLKRHKRKGRFKRLLEHSFWWYLMAFNIAVVLFFYVNLKATGSLYY